MYLRIWGIDGAFCRTKLIFLEINLDTPLPGLEPPAYKSFLLKTGLEAGSQQLYKIQIMFIITINIFSKPL